ncbi:allergen Tha p 1-like [Achroia grisella]|uniref:allergen Tha p 1-like n=1 Tax=Achroia grisella TaxID=688607 RepID=UPI0027D26C71|nr:allergen Tha p 1-like [Achroia grisella]XP_059060894.1 allergen Tha p 1-like [Achroia grisella]
MRTFFILAIAAFAVCTAKYTEILQDETKLRAALDCVLDRTPCDPQQQELKDKFPRIISTACSTCTPEQKTRYEAAKKIIKDKYPSDFELLKAKYAPKP